MSDTKPAATIELSMEERFEVARLKAQAARMSQAQLHDFVEGLVMAVFAERAAKKWLLSQMLDGKKPSDLPDDITVKIEGC